MAVLSFSSCNCLLVALVLSQLLYYAEFYSASRVKPTLPEITSERKIIINSEKSRAVNPENLAQIEAGIVPIVHGDSTSSTVNGSLTLPAKAEVRLFMPKLKNSFGAKEEWPIRASSILMDYDEDTRKYLSPKGDEERVMSLHIRHILHKLNAPQTSARDEYTAANDAPLNEKENSAKHPFKEESTTKLRGKIRIPVRALIYGRDATSFAPQKMQTWKPKQNDTWVAFHSPEKIYIPVINDIDKKSFSSEISENCVQCPSNITVISSKMENAAKAPVPPISICPRLSHTRGRLNIAVVSGPRPGIDIKEGNYSVEIIVWKYKEQAYSCYYNLSVIVKKCKDVSIPRNGFVNCSAENLWGSVCTFSCLSDYALVGHSSVACEEDFGKLSWTSHFPECQNKPNYTKETAPHITSPSHLSCEKLHNPPNGTVICNTNDKNTYPDGSVCQYFCYPDFVIEKLFTNNILVVCKNGLWTPYSHVNCVATFCPEPKLPRYGRIQCEKVYKERITKSKFRNGTTCDFHCNDGYTIPLSQKKLKRTVCDAPFWNSRTVPECKQMEPPRPDPEKCRNQILIANRKGFAKLKSLYFTSSDSKKIMGNCMLKGKVRIGSYINYCTAFDKELNITGNCTYSVDVKENTCSAPPPVLHASIECNNLNSTIYPRTVCKYMCKEGFIIPKRQKKFKSRLCSSKLKWRPSLIPVCKKAIPPIPKRNSCTSKVLFLNENSKNVKVKTPKFKSSLKGSKVKVKCTLKELSSAGNYTNICEAFDTQLQLASSCIYNVVVEEKKCSALPEIADGHINCSSFQNQPHSVSLKTVCMYVCNEGYVIPTSLLQYSVKLCDNHGIWNTSIIPECVYQSIPTASADTCLDQSVIVDDLDSFTITLPKFKSYIGANLAVNCHPQIFANYSVHNINCSAYEPELRTTGFCSFQLDLMKSNDVAEFQQAESGCIMPEPIKNGRLQCDNVSKLIIPGTTCEVICNDHYIIPKLQRDSIFSMCDTDGTWNVSAIPECLKVDSPALVSGCISTSFETSDPALINISLPDFKTSTNSSANVTCYPEKFDEFREYEILCTAEDTVLGISASCAFYITLNANTNPLISNFTTLTLEPNFSTPENKVLPCKPLSESGRTIVNCSDDFPLAKCSVRCEEGYEYSASYPILRKGSVECDGTDGLWNYERLYNLSHFPDCLALLPNTSVKVFLSFNATVVKCDGNDEIKFQTLMKDVLLSLNDDVCEEINCSLLQTSCHPIKNYFVFVVNWTLQTSYDPLKYSETTEVPEFETNFETVIITSKNAIKNKDWFKDKLLDEGIQLNQNSFLQSHIFLACEEEGYGVDEINNKCIACPSGTMEKEDKCEPCTTGYYQLNSGQTTCNSCLNETATFSSGITAICSN